MNRGQLTQAALACTAAFLLGTATPSGADPGAVNESARHIPVAYDVDVVVVGGSTGAVSAAVAAAQEGAKVFLAAPNTYMGDDMTATLRLWLEEGEEPATELAKRIFSDSAQGGGGPDPNRIPFTYTADRPAAAVHADTKPPSRLTDGLWASASKESVQYDGDVSITADLGKAREIELARVVAFYRGSSTEKATGFKVQGIAVFTSDDGKTWHEAGQLRGDKADETGDPPVAFAGPVKATARYVRLDVKKAPEAGRVLLGEIELVGPAKAVVQAKKLPPMPRPMHVKKTLDEALLEAKTPFLFGCLVTDVLVDERGNPCGIVMANRAGRQAVIAKRIIDATPRASVARLAGARFRPYPAGVQSFQRVVIGGTPRTGEGMTHRLVGTGFAGRIPNRAEGSGGRYPVIEYTLRIPMADSSPASWAKADQIARTMTFDPDQQITADDLFQAPPDPIETAPGSPAAGRADPLASYQAQGKPEILVLGGCAALPRDEAVRLLRPLRLMETGDRIGRAAARQAAKAGRPQGAHVAGKPAERPAAAGDVKEELGGVRPGVTGAKGLPSVPQAARALPVLGRYDVVVIGGGTGGAPAGIGAARTGAKTLVCEFLHGLGGVGTTGYISKYYWGNRVGFTASVPEGGDWVPERRAEWWRSEILKVGGDLWFGTIGCGAFVEDGVVKGAVVATPHGRGVVLAKAVIDATGNSDVAAPAGADCYYTDQTELAMQGTGLPPRRLGATYTNTDFTITDETDMLDMWHLFVYSKNKYADAFDQGQLIDTRERRRIVGDFTMTLLDQVLGRTYPDSVCVAYSNFDSHGYTVDPYLELEHPGHKGYRIYVPYRCMLPKGLEGILVIGLGISVHRDAVPMTRMQPDIQNGGYAAGVAAAMAVKAGSPLRQVDMAALKKHLVEIGNLPPSALEDKDNFPLPREKVAAAVATVKDQFQGVGVLLAQPREALPLVKKAYAEAQTGQDKLAYARVLAVLGDNSGVETIIAEVRKHKEWDKGWNYVGMGQFGTALSPLDQLIVGLGRARDPRAVPAILEKVKLLSAKHDFSHHRAVAMALEMIGDRSAAPALAGLLTQPDMSGYVHDSVEEARRRDQESPGGTNAVQGRRDSLMELHLARALYRCGDYGNIGKEILTRYTKDLRGHFARHAKAVLDEGQKAPPNKP